MLSRGAAPRYRAVLVSIILTMGTLAATAITSGTSSANNTRRCGDAGPVGDSTATGIGAKGVSCRRARRVARQYLRHNDVRGWRCTVRRSGRRLCTRKCLGVSFGVLGTGAPE